MGEGDFCDSGVVVGDVTFAMGVFSPMDTVRSGSMGDNRSDDYSTRRCALQEIAAEFLRRHEELQTEVVDPVDEEGTDRLGRKIDRDR